MSKNNVLISAKMAFGMTGSKGRSNVTYVKKLGLPLLFLGDFMEMDYLCKTF